MVRLKGNAIYFTAEEIKAIYEFDCNFDNYFSAVRDKELYEWLLSQGIWLILDKFSHCAVQAMQLQQERTSIFLIER